MVYRSCKTCGGRLRCVKTGVTVLFVKSVAFWSADEYKCSECGEKEYIFALEPFAEGDETLKVYEKLKSKVEIITLEK